MRRIIRFLAFAAILVLFLGGGAAFLVWRKVQAPVTDFTEESRLLFIPTGAGIAEVKDSLRAIGALGDERIFDEVVERKNYARRVKPGRYRVPRGMAVIPLVDLLRSGEQEPVNVTFNNIRRMTELAGRLSRQLEADSLQFLSVFTDPEVQRAHGHTAETFPAMFLPDTYSLPWNTSPEDLVKRMAREHAAYWNDARRAKAEGRRLDPVQVATLASIVQEETARADEAPRIAGVYLNRLRIGMPLQADPTLKFALGMDSVRRVLDRDKLVDSPYNTYRNAGLPPGPIVMPEKRYLNAVLDAEEHAYLYFCARADLSGYSEFARTYDQHLVNARRYQKALDARRIYR